MLVSVLTIAFLLHSYACNRGKTPVPGQQVTPAEVAHLIEVRAGTEGDDEQSKYGVSKWQLCKIVGRQ